MNTYRPTFPATPPGIKRNPWHVRALANCGYCLFAFGLICFFCGICLLERISRPFRKQAPLSSPTDKEMTS